MRIYDFKVKYGCKYVAHIKGRLREVYLVAVVYDDTCEKDVPNCILHVAGVGKVETKIKNMESGDNSILAKNEEDYYNDVKIKIEAFDIHDKIPDAYQQYFPRDFRMTGYYVAKDGRIESKSYTWNKWRIDKNGLVTDIDFNELYPTVQNCLADHPELKLVKFFDEDGCETPLEVEEAKNDYIRKVTLQKEMFRIVRTGYACYSWKYTNPKDGTSYIRESDNTPLYDRWQEAKATDEFPEELFSDILHHIMEVY